MATPITPVEDVNFEKLKFGYVHTPHNVRCHYSNGKWGELEVCDTDEIKLNIASIVLHYGQAAFEGCKAFKGKDGKIRTFRLDENFNRINRSADGIMMPRVPEEVFFPAVEKCIKLNKEYVPPYGLDGSLYIRPLLFGSSPKVGVSPSEEYEFIVFVTPVGPYFAGGFKGVKMQIARDHDRAAPLGTGCIKVAGNYAASLVPCMRAHKEGYANCIFLDAKSKTYLDECGAANIIIIKGNKYITPKSTSILPSITNMSLRTIAKELGLEVEQREVCIDELDDAEEVGACGTAAVISPISEIDDRDTGKKYVFSKTGEAGPWCVKLRNYLVDVQNGVIEDKFNWTKVIEVDN